MPREKKKKKDELKMALKGFLEIGKISPFQENINKKGENSKSTQFLYFLKTKSKEVSLC